MDTLTLQVQCLQVRQLAHLGRKGRCPLRAKLVACSQSSKQHQTQMHPIMIQINRKGAMNK